jgi:hypothetical protein
MNLPETADLFLTSQMVLCVLPHPTSLRTHIRHQHSDAERQQPLDPIELHARSGRSSRVGRVPSNNSRAGHNSNMRRFEGTGCGTFMGGRFAEGYKEGAAVQM